MPRGCRGGHFWAGVAAWRRGPGGVRAERPPSHMRHEVQAAPSLGSPSHSLIPIPGLIGASSLRFPARRRQLTRFRFGPLQKGPTQSISSLAVVARRSNHKQNKPQTHRALASSCTRDGSQAGEPSAAPCLAVGAPWPLCWGAGRQGALQPPHDLSAMPWLSLPPHHPHHPTATILPCHAIATPGHLPCHDLCAPLQSPCHPWLPFPCSSPAGTFANPRPSAKALTSIGHPLAIPWPAFASVPSCWHPLAILLPSPFRPLAIPLPFVCEAGRRRR